MKYYMAICDGKKWVCVRANGNSEENKVAAISDFRAFDTFSEADQVAKDCAAGKYNQEKGIYISNR